MCSKTWWLCLRHCQQLAIHRTSKDTGNPVTYVRGLATPDAHSSGGDAVDTHHFLIMPSWNKKCLSKCVTLHSVFINYLWRNAVSHSAETVGYLVSSSVESPPRTWCVVITGGSLALIDTRQGWWKARYDLPIVITCLIIYDAMMQGNDWSLYHRIMVLVSIIMIDQFTSLPCFGVL